MDFLKANGFTVTDREVYGGALALTSAEATNACEMEHAVSPASYEALKMLAKKQKEKV